MKLKRMALSAYGTRHSDILSSNLEEEEEDSHRNKRDFSSDEEDNYNSRDTDINWEEDTLDSHNEQTRLYSRDEAESMPPKVNEDSQFRSGWFGRRRNGARISIIGDEL